MATAFQQIFDKENVGANSSVKNRVGLTLKNRQDNAVGIVTPRRALGNINRDLNIRGQTPSTLKVFKENTESSKLRKNVLNLPKNKLLSENKPKKSVATPLKPISISSQPTAHIDEIEHIHKPLEIEDDYEDIYPSKERISTYLDKLISWRPSCFKNWDVDETTPVHDEEEDELLLIDEMPVVPRITSDAATACEEALYKEPEELPELLEISLPELDDFLELPEELQTKISLGD